MRRFPSDVRDSCWPGTCRRWVFRSVAYEPDENVVVSSRGLTSGFAAAAAAAAAPFCIARFLLVSAALFSKFSWTGVSAITASDCGAP